MTTLLLDLITDALHERGFTCEHGQFATLWTRPEWVGFYHDPTTGEKNDRQETLAQVIASVISQESGFGAMLKQPGKGDSCGT